MNKYIFYNIFQICCMGLGMGASVLTSRYWGMKNLESLKKSVVLIHRMMFVLAMLFSFATFMVPTGIIDILFLWCASIPLGATAGLVLHLPAFWIYFFLKIDQFIKAFWCLFRLRSRKWIKAIKPAQNA